ncbi:hypothetical protein [Streptomyces sp. NPDC058579]|uniref:hypothetical protein n=1 Tax=Streptomyces sp. NPDC058579 TaxID=3346548 RepID=UPI003658D21A
MSTSPPPAGSRVWPVGPHLVIAPEEAEPALAAALSGLAPLSDAVLVLAAAPDAAPVLRRSLPDLVALATDRGAARLVLAASGLAAAGPDGTRPLDAVATTAAFPVIAPDTMVAVEPDGSLRVTPPGTWWLSEPGCTARELGPGWPPRVPEEGAPVESADSDQVDPDQVDPAPAERMPEASGQEEPPPGPPGPPVPVVSESSGGVYAERDGGGPRCRPVPGGFWLGSVPEVVETLIGVGPDDLFIGVGSPRQPALPTAELLDLVAEAAPEPDGLFLAAPWADPAELTGMAVALAVRFARTVRVAVGLPVRTADDHATTFLDERGTPTWQPLLVELTASPEHRRVVPSAWLRLPGLDSKAPAVHRGVCAGWELEAVPAGLWLRPEGTPAAPWPRALRPDPVRPVLVVGDRLHSADPEVWEALPTVLAALPDLGATAPYGLLADGPGTDPETTRAWADTHGLTWLALPAVLDGPEGGPAPDRADGGLAPAPGAPDGTDSGSEPVSALPYEAEEAAPRATGSGGGPQAPAHLEPAASAPTAPDPVSVPDPAAPPGPRSVPAAQQPPVAPAVPAPAVPAPAGPAVRSTPRDRAALRELLGERYHLLAGKAERLASRLPSLRSSPQDDLKPDLVAVALYHSDAPDPVSRAGLVAAARDAGPGPLAHLLCCLGSGLRRLPGHYGAVMLAAPAEDVPLDRYMPGTLLVEPAPVAAVPACDAELEGSVEFGVWSTTGRRTSVFGGPDDEPEVVFPPGTAFSVLALRPPEDDEGPIRVLLREISPAEAAEASAGASDDRFRERDGRARTQLTAWFERRDMLAPEDRRPLPDATRYHLSPGAALH